MKILVTGGAGFIGSHLTEKLSQDNEVYVLDDLSGGNKENLLGIKVKGFFKVDCRNTKKVDEVFRRVKPEIVYHLASNAAENKAQFSPIDITSRNYDAFIKVLTPFIKYGGKRFIFTSSIAVYGSLQTPFKETDKPEPEDLYGVTKLAAEETLKIMSKVHGFEYVITRPHNVYGSKQNMKDPYRNVMTIWMNKILKDEPIEIYGDGEQIRCFSYVDDVVECLYKCASENVAGKTFNVGSSNQYSLNELAQLLAKGEVKYLPERLQEVKVAVSDHSECKKILGYNETPLAEGTKKTWDWVIKQGAQDPIYTELEIDSDKVPSNWKHG